MFDRFLEELGDVTVCMSWKLSGLFKELGDVSSLRGLEESTLVGGGSAWLRREWVALGSLADRRHFA